MDEKSIRESVINNLWHNYTEKPKAGPNGDRLILIFDPKNMDFDITWAAGCPKGYKWLYMDEIMTPDMVSDLHAYERMLDEKFNLSEQAL